MPECTFTVHADCGVWRFPLIYRRYTMYIAVRMTPVCALTVNTDCGVKIVPLIGGIPPTPSIYHIDIFYSYNNNLIFLSLLLITFRY